MTVIVNYRTGTTIRWLYTNTIIGEYRARDMARLEEVESVYINGELVTV